MRQAPFASFGSRVTARLIDELVLVSMALPIVSIFGSEDGVAAPGVFLGLLINLLYDGYLPTTSWQGTLGKRLLHMKIETMDGKRISPLRSLRRLALPLAASFIIQIFTPEDGKIQDPMSAPSSC